MIDIWEVEKLRAELAAERERAEQWRLIAKSEAEDSDRFEAERDALRALLGEVRKMAENGVLYNEPLNARIDAALNKGGGDE